MILALIAFIQTQEIYLSYDMDHATKLLLLNNDSSFPIMVKLYVVEFELN